MAGPNHVGRTSGRGRAALCSPSARPSVRVTVNRFAKKFNQFGQEEEEEERRRTREGGGLTGYVGADEGQLAER